MNHLTGKRAFDGSQVAHIIGSQEGPGGRAPLEAFSSSKLEAVRKQQDEKTPSTGDLTAMEAFDVVFWPAYPRKIAKHEARKAWERLKLKDEDQTTLDAIMAGLAHYIAHEWEPDRPRFVPHAATWLNQRRWEDFS